MKTYSNADIPIIKAAAGFFLGDLKITALSRIKTENIIKISWGIAHFITLAVLFISLIL